MPHYSTGDAPSTWDAPARARGGHAPGCVGIPLMPHPGRAMRSASEAAPGLRRAALLRARAPCPRTWRWRASLFDAECPGVDLSAVGASLQLYFWCPGSQLNTLPQFYAVCPAQPGGDDCDSSSDEDCESAPEAALYIKCPTPQLHGQSNLYSQCPYCLVLRGWTLSSDTTRLPRAFLRRMPHHGRRGPSDLCGVGTFS
jgi:hypothetical protein